jgi:1-acyl-sn-glycerol-3-phosphate acyltransferase
MNLKFLTSLLILFFNVLIAGTVVLFQLLFSPFWLINKKLYHIIDGILWNWGSQCGGFLLYHFRNDLNYKITGDYNEKEGLSGNNLIISNHVSSSDW